MTDRLVVTTAEGKYTVIQTEEGSMRFLRYDQPWPAADAELSYCAVLLALAQDLDEARKRIAELEKKG